MICPIDILEADGYLQNLITAAKIDKTVSGIPKLPSHSGKIEQSQARGVWIPATSADPYAGSNNTNNQKRRDQSAYYTFIYQKAISHLREKASAALLEVCHLR